MPEMVPLAKRANDMKRFFDDRKGEIGVALARVGVTPERIIRAVFTAASKNPQLYDCTLESTYKAVLLAAQSGLMPDGVTQQAHLIPRMNRKRKDSQGKPLPDALECNLQIGYRGYLTLCRRSGDVEVITAYLVRRGDKFAVTDGVPSHEPLQRDGFPALTDDDGKERPIVGVWAKAQFKSGSVDYEVMPIDEIEMLRIRAGAKGQAWDTDYGEMVKKTVMRRLCKRLPQSEDAARLLELDAQAEGGQPQDLFDIDIAKRVQADVAPAEADPPPPDDRPSGGPIPGALRQGDLL